MEGQKQKSTIASLDGVRGIACLIVVIFHISRITRSTHLWNPQDRDLVHRIIGSILFSGASGVSLFFVLSGFLLFMPFAKYFLFETRRLSTTAFYLRRAFRILPGYYASLLLLTMITHPEYLHLDHLKDMLLFFTLFMDSTKQTFMQINGPFWTLAVEWQFYLLLPLLMLGFSLLVMRLPRKWRVYALLFCLAGVVAWGIWTRVWGPYYATQVTQSVLVPLPIFRVFLFFAYGFTGKYLEDFAIGMMVSLLYIYASHTLSPRKLSMILRQLSPLLFCAGLLVLLTVALWHFNIEYPHSWVHLDSFMPYYNDVSEAFFTGGYGLCIIAILFGPPWLRQPFEWSPLRWIGLVSYSLYMWHLPLLYFFSTYVAVLFTAHMNRVAVIGLYFVWVLLAIFPFAFCSYLLIEKPWIEMGSKLLNATGMKKAEPPALKETNVPQVSMTTQQLADFEPAQR